jgi:hypothetical protein
MPRPLTLLLLMAIVAGCGLVQESSGLACQQPPDGNWSLDGRQVPELNGLRPDEAASRLEATDIDASWRYSYATTPDRRGGYSECWCEPPPDGTVMDVATGSGGWLIVMVERPQPMMGGRDQPALGWGC